MNSTRFSHFAPILLQKGAAAARDADTRLAYAPPYEIFYIPFEHVNASARLVLVGITPGPKQLELAYAEVQRQLRLKVAEQDLLARVKAIAGFGGEAMRPNLLRILRHFDFADLLDIGDEADLWGSAAHLLYATSVVPNAAFKSGKPFAGSFEEILRVDALRKCFEADFVASLAALSGNALYIALGKTPFDALSYCVAHDVIAEHQLLGAFAHPSRSGGSQVAIYLGEKSPGDLKPTDPVNKRLDWLCAAYVQMRSNVERLCAGKPTVAVSR